MTKEKKNISRREAVKSLGVIASLPVLGSVASGQHAAHSRAESAQATAKGAASKAAPLKFFTPAENRALAELSERIIPTDDNSPGAKAAKVNEYIDMVVNLRDEPVKRAWRDGLAAINRLSQERFGKEFADASEAQQIALLTEISRNEKSPQTVEEKFFKLVKDATIDGYYSSEIGIHQELKYRGNTYLKEFTGCTHPEHQRG